MGSAGGRHAAIAGSADGASALKGPVSYNEVEQLWDALRDNSRRLGRVERGERRLRSSPPTPGSSTPLSFAEPCTPLRAEHRFDSTSTEAAGQHGPSTPCGEVCSEEASLQQLLANELKAQLRNCEVKLEVAETQSARLAMEVNTSSTRMDRLQDFIVERLGGDTETAPWLLRPEKRPNLDVGSELDDGAGKSSGVPAEQPLPPSLSTSPEALDADTGAAPRQPSGDFDDMMYQMREMQRRMQELEVAHGPLQSMEARVQALESQAVHAEQLQGLSETSADHAHRLQELEAEVKAAHREQLQSLSTASDELAHGLQELKAQASIDDVQRLLESTAGHAQRLDELKSQVLESRAVHSEQMQCLSATSADHAHRLQEVEAEALKAQADHKEKLQTLSTAADDLAHSLQELKAQATTNDVQRLLETTAGHAQRLDDLESQATTNDVQRLLETTAGHDQRLDDLESQARGQRDSSTADVNGLLEEHKRTEGDRDGQEMWQQASERSAAACAALDRGVRALGLHSTRSPEAPGAKAKELRDREGERSPDVQELASNLAKLKLDVDRMVSSPKPSFKTSSAAMDELRHFRNEQVEQTRQLKSYVEDRFTSTRGNILELHRRLDGLTERVYGVEVGRPKLREQGSGSQRPLLSTASTVPVRSQSGHVSHATSKSPTGWSGVTQGGNTVPRGVAHARMSQWRNETEFKTYRPPRESPGIPCGTPVGSRSRSRACRDDQGSTQLFVTLPPQWQSDSGSILIGATSQSPSRQLFPPVCAERSREGTPPPPMASNRAAPRRRTASIRATQASTQADQRRYSTDREANPQPLAELPMPATWVAA